MTKQLLRAPGGGSAPTASSLPTNTPVSKCFGRAVHRDGSSSENTAKHSRFSLHNHKYSPCKPLEKGYVKQTSNGKQESLIVAVQLHPQIAGERKRKSNSSSTKPGRGPSHVGIPFLPPNATSGHSPGDSCCCAWVLHPLEGQKREGSSKNLPF